MKKLVFLALCLCSAVAFAQDEVTIVVSADGATKTQATDNALRSAIEQTFGTFVSANTEILNDQLVKDEIATVSSGNIKKYKEIAVVVLPNGNTSVTLNVTVSLKKLIKYAQSKGSECEFAGALFGVNHRLYKYYSQNEQIVIKNMIRQLNALRPIYDFEILVSEPQYNGQSASLSMKVTAKANEKTNLFFQILNTTLNELGMTESQIEPMRKMGYTFHEQYFDFKDKKNRNNNKPLLFFYNKLNPDIARLIIGCLYDYAITDNTGAIFFSDVTCIIPSDKISFDLREGSIWNSGFMNVVIPISQIEKINRISIRPTTRGRTNELKGGRDYRLSMTYITDELEIEDKLSIESYNY